MITTIGTAMIEVMRENECTSVLWGDAYLLDMAFRKSGSRARNDHPLNRWQVVLNALDRDHRFEKGFVRLDIFRNGGQRLVRSFTLIENV